jgi:UDP-N-acetyl-D-glucosamine dehydrogenase
LALSFAEAGFGTRGFDIDHAKVTRLCRGASYLRHIPNEAIARQIGSGKLQPTADLALLREMDAVIICVPTPLDGHREPDLSFVCETAKAVSNHLRPQQLVVLESTSYPGTTEEVVLPILERSELRCPVTPYSVHGNEVDDSSDLEGEFYLAFSPEREDPGNNQIQRHEVPKVIGGVNGASARAAQALYQQLFKRTVLVSSARVAEMTKILENTYRSVNIALVNELKLLCMRMGIDIWEVIEAAKSKPFGFSGFYPGPGLGGHCIPIDPFYLTWKAREYGFSTRFIELAGEINSAMPFHVVSTIGAALNPKGQCLQGAKILILGVAYKKDLDDLRESPALRIIELLSHQGSAVDYHDPFIPELPKTRTYDFRLRSVQITAETLPKYHAVVIITNHSTLDYHFIVQHSRLVIDTRNATHAVTSGREKIVKC